MSPCTYAPHVVDPNNNDECCICYDPLNKGSVLAHSLGGNLHPIHQKCVELWIQRNPICPSCRVGVILPFSWKRKIKELLMAADDLASTETVNVLFIIYIAVYLAEEAL